MASGISAIGWRDLQVVIVVDVARGAWHAGVTVGQQKTCGAVVKLGVGPCVKRVAGFAGGRKIRCSVIWTRSFLKIAQVTRSAGRR